MQLSFSMPILGHNDVGLQNSQSSPERFDRKQWTFSPRLKARRMTRNIFIYVKGQCPRPLQMAEPTKAPKQLSAAPQKSFCRLISIISGAKYWALTGAITVRPVTSPSVHEEFKWRLPMHLQKILKSTWLWKPPVFHGQIDYFNGHVQ